MSAMTERSRTLGTPDHQINHDLAQTAETQKISAYEQSREQRIKENKERMQKLGIVSLSLQLNSAVSAAGRRALKTPSDRNSFQRSTPLPPSGPTRRSSRLQNATPVSYTEVPLSKKNDHLEDNELLLENGSRPEVYTEEHEKLLGSTERSWTLFVDGCGIDGKRIYDSVKGKTCHQCRQKTLGLRTQCSNCGMVQGQFCGDCLYMRYGEHVLEANENPNWVCPVCRGICNCSLCRQAKGWPPTGALYRKILKLGFKSVAHYLIQTRRKETNVEDSQDTIHQASAKRSLPFLDMEAQSPGNNGDLPGSVKPESEDKTCDDQLNGERESEVQNILNPSSGSQPSAKRPLPFSNKEALLENIKVSDEEARHDVAKISEPSLTPLECGPDDKVQERVAHDYPGQLELQSDNKTCEQVEGNPGQLELQSDNRTCEQVEGKDEQVDANCALGNTPKVSDVKARHDVAKISEPSLTPLEYGPDDKVQERVAHDYPGQLELQSDNKTCEQVEGNPGQLELQSDNKTGEQVEGKDEQVDANCALGNTPKLKRNRALVSEPTQDSIARRLKQRRRGRGNNHDDEDNISTEKEVQFTDNKHGDNNTTLQNNPNLKHQPVLSTAGGLRRSCRNGKGRHDEKALGNEGELKMKL